MKIPSNLTKEQTVEIMQRVCKKFRSFAFDIYSGDDIEQEAFILCLDGLKRYKEKNGHLENFLSVHVRNRLINFTKRENSNKNAKFLINYAIPLEGVNDQDEKNMRYEGDAENVAIRQELFDKINEIMPVEHRMDFIRLTRGVKISKVRKQKVLAIIRKYIYGEETEE